ncbi:MAG TPA: B-box zinc finger protein [Terriglobales bacterium]|nr:B-box zinc finger protein [Terriglobales bacterium]
MNCAIHPEVAGTAFCRTCGKSLCEECKRDVRGVIYCEECIAARLAGTAPGVGAPGAGNPVLAALLGLIPGVGAMYNGQFGKGLVHVVIFAVLVTLADSGQYEPLWGILIMFFFFYQVFDAYRTAKARLLGQPVPDDPLGLSRGLWGPGESAGSFSHVPTGAIVLIGLGVLFLLSNAGLFHWNWIGKLWPLILIALGIRMYMRRSAAGR